MAKVWTFIIISTGIMLLMKFAGIPAGLDAILFGMGITDTLASNGSTFFIALVALFGLAAAGGITIGTLGGTPAEFAFKAPFAIANLLLFAGTFVGIATYAHSFDSYIYNIVFFVMSLFSIGFLWASISWVFGGDD